MAGTGFKCAIARTSRDIIRTCVIPQNFVDDNLYDCRDQSDACHIPGKCFKCVTMEFYVSTKQVCDGIFDCPDASDECLCGNVEENRVMEFCANFCFLEGMQSYIKMTFSITCE